MLNDVRDWLEERTGLPSAIHHFLDEDIPASSGWVQVLGSVAMFAFLVQAVTGILLALNYGPTPSEAHASLRYIMTELTAGPMIRGLHHWGASCMIVVVVLHMVQVFIWGAYKRPREATWIAGCALLLLTLAFGLTGYLLPWDNKAYWGTTVTVHIMGLAPGAGPYLQRLLGADNEAVGTITFARFYSAHVIILPIIVLGLIVLHLYLVRKHGVTPSPEDAGKPKKKFFPEQVFKDSVAMFGYVMVLVLFANFAKLGLGSLADPTNTRYTPRPEWYFLFLFQMLKLFPGKLEVLGAVVLPNLAIVGLFLVPFFDRAKAIRVRNRTVAIAMAVFAAIGWAGLTQRAVATTEPSMEDVDAGLTPPQAWRELPPEQLAAIGYFEKAKCSQCHVLERTTAGPDLAKEPSTKGSEWLLAHFTKPTADSPDSGLTEAQKKALVALVTKRDDRTLEAWENPPEAAIAGAMLYGTNGCAFCHTLNGSGANQAPVLNGLAARRTRTWVAAHFEDPPKLSPNSEMPAYKFNAQDLNAITDYVMSIPK